LNPSTCVPRENNKENPIVQNKNTPNCLKNCTLAKNINADAPRVVHAPENTEVPISSRDKCRKKKEEKIKYSEGNIYIVY
jgi:hypothetical protein